MLEVITKYGVVFYLMGAAVAIGFAAKNARLLHSAENGAGSK